MRSLSNWLLILCLLCMTHFAPSAKAQPQRIPQTQKGVTKTQKKSDEHPSHRRLPLASDRPIKSLLNNPELLELRKQYSQLRREQSQMRRQMEIDSQVQPRDGETMEQAIERNDALAEELRRNFPPTDSKPFEDEIRSFSESLGKSLDEKLSETFQPGSVEFDSKDTNPWDRVLRLRDELSRKQKEINQKVAKAKEMLKEQWPTDSVAPGEWLEKVQPFINTEVIEQLTEASRQFNAQEHLPPNERRFQDIEKIPSLANRDRSGSMFDSFMTSIDKQGTDWLKSSDKDKSSLWKSLKDSAKSGIKTLNRSMTENSQRQAKVPSTRPSNSIKNSRAPTVTRRPRGSSSASPSKLNQAVWIWIGGLAALLGIGTLAYFYRDSFSSSEGMATKDPLLAEQIRDRDTLLAACHTLARQLFGVRSRFWNHRRLFENLSGNLSERSERGHHVVDQLSRIYETARYAPVHLADDEFSRARDLFSTLQNELQTSA